MNQTNLLNFKPTRLDRDIANEYVARSARCTNPTPTWTGFTATMKMGHPGSRGLNRLVDLKALTIVVWRQGIKRNTRTRFWRYLLGMARNLPCLNSSYRCWPTTSTSSSTADRSVGNPRAAGMDPQKQQQPKNSS